MENSSNKMHENALKLERFQKEDLKYVEMDLSFNDKVSIAFLLFGSDKINAQYILQRLLIFSNPLNKSPSDILESFAKLNPNWRHHILESLSIMKLNRVIKKLGFCTDDLYVQYLPQIPQITSHINQNIKALYMLCEKLTPGEAGKLILDINDRVECHTKFYDHSLMEIFLLDWISKNIIKIGNDDNCNDCKTNIDVILEHLKLNEMYSHKDWLNESINIPKEPSGCSETKLQSETECNHQNVRDSAFTSELQIDKFDRKDSCPIIADDCYVVRKDTAGFALIINEREFYEETNEDLKEFLPTTKLNERKGTDVDKTLLKNIFSTFGYIPIIKDNLKHYEILNLLRDTVKRSIVKDSLIVCILSHGIRGAVYGSNSIPIEISKIEEIMTAESLLNKPKWLIIQACQGDQIQKAIPISRLETDGLNSAPAYGDMITAMSTVPGFASIRHTEKGTWFIQSLCKKINELGDRKHVSDILTAVNLDVSNKRGLDGQCMVPLTSQTLRKGFYLPRRF